MIQTDFWTLVWVILLADFVAYCVLRGFTVLLIWVAKALGMPDE